MSSGSVLFVRATAGLRQPLARRMGSFGIVELGIEVLKLIISAPVGVKALGVLLRTLALQVGPVDVVPVDDLVRAVDALLLFQQTVLAKSRLSFPAKVLIQVQDIVATECCFGPAARATLEDEKVFHGLILRTVA